MHMFSKFVVGHTKTIITVFLVLMVLGGILSTGVKINLDNTSYLPDSMNSKQAIHKLDETFGMKGNASILIKNKTIYDVLDIKEEISTVNGVKDVIWLDDYTDIQVPLEFIETAYINQFYKNGNALLQVLFTDINDSETTFDAISKISELVADDEDIYISGPSVVSNNMADRISNEIIIYSLVAVVLILIILFTSTTSWLEPILFLLTIGIAILINMGLNFFKGEVSQTTFAAASLLQLAVSMDYMIFLLHRFHEHRNQGENVKEAMINSLKNSYSSIVASAVTTIAGFTALTLMNFGIGRDIGFVLARGVFISLITVMTFLPAITIVLDKWIEKYTHKEISPRFNSISKIAIKGRYVFIVFVFLFSFIFYLAQSKINYYYSNENFLPDNDSAIVASKVINEIYDDSHQNMLIIPNTDKVQEKLLVEELSTLSYVSDVSSLYAQTGTELPEIMLPDAVKDNFQSQNYSMITYKLNTGKENHEGFAAVEEIRTITSKYYDEYYAAGEVFSYKDLKDVTDNDFTTVTIFSIIFIFIILAITFKSLFIPIFTIFIIQMAIWVNVGIAYFAGSKMSFITFIVIGAIQLGATVDYAILFINRYKENIKDMPPIKAASETIKNTAKSIITSAAILVAATFAVHFIATIKASSEMCLLIGRGAIISVIGVLFALPGFLIIFDPVIRVTTLNWSSSKKRRQGKKIKMRGVENEV